MQDFRKTEQWLTQHQREKNHSPERDKKKPEEIVAENYNLVKEKEQNFLHQTWEEYENAQNNLMNLTDKLNKGGDRYKSEINR
jgi:hypothetical protein